VGCDSKGEFVSPTGPSPTSGPRPINSQTSEMNWWIVEDRYAPSQRILASGSVGQHTASIPGNRTNIDFVVGVDAPQVPGHHIMLRLTDGLETPPRVSESSGVTDDRPLHLEIAEVLDDLNGPGVYEVSVCVEETGSDLPGLVVLEARVMVTVR